MKTIKSFSILAAAALLSLGAVACKGRTNDNVEPTGDTVEVNPLQPAETDSMNHDAEAVTLPDAVEVPE